MSVINRMLRDLDQRKQQTNKQSYTPAAVAPQPLSKQRLAAISAIVVALSLVIWALIWWFSPSAKVDTQPMTPAAVEVVESAAPEAVMAAESKPEAEPEPEPEPEPSAAVELKPGPILTAEQRQMNEQTALDSAVDSSVPEVEAEPALAANQEPQPELETESEPEAQAETEIESSLSVQRVQLSPAELVSNNLEKARAALQKGDRERAQALFEEALRVAPRHTAARSEYAAYWYGRGFARRAVAILQQGLELNPDNSDWQLLLARIYTRSGRVSEAYEMLASSTAAVSQRPELFELRAQLASQLDQHSRAASDYAELAQYLDSGRFWLAAAVAADDAGNLQLARAAYQRAANHPSLAQAGKDYARQRLLDLGGQ